ncbi:MAG: dihydrolipoyllysine-residue acetyltransferase [Legionella sp.]|nr:dihydrolipoyllysine-residue acetyltransferase [Legionella sp.]
MADEIEIKIPDIGGAAQVDVIEILVKVGDEIKKDASLVTLESDKASMEIPSPIAGKISKIQLKVGDKVTEGDTILFVSEMASDTGDKNEKKVTELEAKAPEPEPNLTKEEPQVVETQSIPSSEPSKSNENISQENTSNSDLLAGPAVRRLAREFGVQLEQVRGSGRKNRLTKEDLQTYVKSQLMQNQNAPSSSFNPPSAPIIDFSKFGAIETKALNKIKKLTGAQVHRSWISIPHVTQFDEADITELEAFRKAEFEKVGEEGLKLTILAFVCRVVSKALHIYPQFNASLDASGNNLIYKKYCNIGIAVETPNGLVVPVIKDADKGSVTDIAKEMTRLSHKAREKGLMPSDMAGGCFTISSLGGIGGTAFTPIVNSPEVAILGLSRAMVKAVYVKDEFKPRLMLPLSLSYDHRVIDGAEAARFTRFICDCLQDIRRILL